jgi:hypothetical protein
MYGEVDGKLKSLERVGLYTEADHLAGITPRGLAADLAFAFGRLGELHRFPRTAVVTDRPWLCGVTNFENALLRKIELRPFPNAERRAAMNWVAELPAELRKPALRVIPTTRADTIAFAVDGLIAAEEAADLVREADAALADHERIRLLGRIGSHFGISPSAFKQAGLAGFKWRVRNRIDRYAVVGGPRWLPTWVATLRGLTGLNLRHFDERDENAAWTWIDARPA